MLSAIVRGSIPYLNYAAPYAVVVAAPVAVVASSNFFECHCLHREKL